MIRVEHLSKSYGAVAAIRDVSFEVEEGEIVGFLGPNGAGKTTTIKILTGFMPCTSGTAFVDGLDVLEHPLDVKKRIGYLPESVPLYGAMTVDRYLRFVGEARGLSRKECAGEVDRVVEACGLVSVQKRVISHLSKGFRQRVGLAQALLDRPPLLILDEPTIGLDPAQIVEIRKLILGLKEHHTVLLSSHILPEVSQVCDRVIIINKGEIVATDTPENLTLRTRGLEQIRVQVKGSDRDVLAALERIDGVRSAARDSGEGVFIVTSEPGSDLRPAIARTVVERGWELLELHRISMSLEDIFVRLVTDENGAQE